MRFCENVREDWQIIFVRTQTNLFMNFESLTPEERKLIVDLCKRVEVWESNLKRLQDKIVRIDGKITSEVAKKFKYINLN
jgi:hypothetical protein